MPPTLPPGGDFATRAHVRFALDGDGFMLGENDPTRQSGARSWLQRSHDQVTWRLRASLPNDVKGEIAALAAAEPPFRDDATPPAHWARYRAILERAGPVEVERHGPVYLVEHNLPVPAGYSFLASEDAAPLIETWWKNGMPKPLFDIGFTDPDELWAPWRVLLIDGEPAAVGQTARMSPFGVECGVITVPDHRLKGLGAAVVSAWSHAPALAGLPLYYSTSHDNVGSQGIARRLGAMRVGDEWSLS